MPPWVWRSLLPATRRSIADGLRKLGLKKGVWVAVHSSMKSLGPVDGGPDAIIAALQDVVGPQGNIIMPTFSGPVNVFDVRTTPSRVGLITDVFRRTPGVLRSLNPTHSVAAWGRNKRRLAGGHPKAEELGVDSPFHRLSRRGGWVLGIGVDFRSCSLVHVAEAIAGAPYQQIYFSGYDRTSTLVDAKGRRRRYRPRVNPGCSANFLVVQDRLRRAGRLQTGKVAVAACYLAKGEDILNAARELLAKDPAALLCRNRGCRVCGKKRELLRRLARRGDELRASS